MAQCIAIYTALLGCAGLSVACVDSEQRRTTSIERGLSYLAQRSLDKARVEFSSALQIQPDDAGTTYWLGVVHERLDDPEQAIRYFDAALGLDADHFGARSSLARIYTFGGFPDDAIDLLNEVLPRFPDNADLLSARALARTRQGDLSGARQDVTLALQSEPGSENAIALLAGIMRAEGQTENASVLLEDGLRHNPGSTDLRVALAFVSAEAGATDRAAELLEQTVELEPDDDTFRYQLIRFHIDTGNLDAAQSRLEELATLRVAAVEPKLALLAFLSRHRSPDEARSAADRMVAQAEHDPELVLALSDLYGEFGAAAERTALLQDVVGRDANGPFGLQARTRLAVVALSAGRRSAAESYIEQVLAVNSRDAEALGLRAYLSLTDGRGADAIVDARAALSTEPDSLPMLRLLAQAYGQDGQQELALAALEAALRRFPDDAELRLATVQQQLDAGQLDRGRLARASEILRPLLLAATPAAAALEQQYRIEMRLNAYSEAQQVALRLKAQEPDSARASLLIAAAAEQAGNVSEAAAHYRAALDLDAAQFATVQGLARMALANGEFAAAAAHLESYIAAQPEHVEALDALSRIYSQAGQYGKAEALAQRAMAVAPDSILGYRSAAESRLRKGDLDGAAATLRIGFERNNDLQLGFALAGLLEPSGRFEEAIETYARMLKAHPDSLPVANNLAMLLAEHRSDAASLSEALEIARRFAGSDQAPLLDTFGWAAYRAGDLKAALPALRRAAELAPELPTLRYHLGLALLADERGDAGRRELETALSLDEDFREAEAARDALRLVAATQVDP
jgi:tetratricopeptide (TPR) repeat protein